MKKKKGMGLIAGLIALVLLTGVYFIVSSLSADSQEDEAETTAQSEEIEGLSMEEEDIVSIAIKNENGSMEFEKNEDEWAYKEDADFPLEQSGFENLVQKIQSAQAKRKLSQPEDLGEYGLEEPKTQVEVTLKDETSHTFYFGDENSSTGDYYMYMDSPENVYTVDSALAEAFSCKLYDLAQVSAFPTIDSASVTGLKIVQGDTTTAFTKGEESGTWMIQKTGEETLKADTDEAGTIIDQTGSLEFSSFVDYKDTDEASYGLDAPSAVITIDYTETETVEPESETEEDTEELSEETSETASEETESETQETETVTVEKQQVLEVGDQDSDGNYYVRLKGSQEIYTMSASVLDTWLNISYENTLNRYVSYVPMTGMESLKVTYEGKTYTLRMEEQETESAEEDTTEEETTEAKSAEGETAEEETTEAKSAETEATGEETTEAESAEMETTGEESTEAETETEAEPEYLYYVNDQEVSQDAFTKFYNLAYQMKAQSRTNDLPQLEGEEELVLEFTKTDGSTVKVSYQPCEGGLYAAQIKGEPGGIMNKQDVVSLKESLEELIK